MNHSGMRAGWLLAVVAMFSVSVWAGDAARTLDETTAQALVNARGYRAPAFSVDAHWTLRLPEQADGFVQGFRIRDTQSDEVFEQYAINGAWLSEAQCAALGLKPVTGESRTEAPFEPAAAPESSPLPKTLPRPLALQHHIKPGVSGIVPAPDLDAVLLEDQATGYDGAKGPERIGVFQPLNQPIILSGATGTWKPLPDGAALWLAAVDAPGALGLRLEISALELPQGASIVVYGQDAPDLAFGPYHRIPEGETSLWLPTCAGTRVLLECRVPFGADPAAVRLNVARAAYVYKLPAAIEAAAGACNKDVTCYPDWAETAKAVGGLGVIGNTGVLFCTCTRIADLNRSTNVPYVLTANHCVRGQTGTYGASSLEFYWFYQTGACNAAPPSLLSVPRTTGGADYLAGMTGTGTTGGGNDFTFLRMRQAPPATTPQLGWTARVPALGQELACMSHPQGEFKRIAFGNNTGLSTYYHTMTWHTGTTEGGSSGSSLVLADTRQIIGQLWGGFASCNRPSDPDYYGRFDVTYAIVSSYLGTMPTARLGASAYAVAESAGTLSIPVTLSSAANPPWTAIGYTLAAGTAQTGDFEAAEGVLTFPGGATQGSITVTVLPDWHMEPTETILLTLHTPQYMLLDSGAAQATVSILDSDIDTDGDGLSDDEETLGVYGHPSNPAMPDTDLDGLSDREELLGSHGPATNPEQADTDGDGVNDGLEIAAGTSPTNPGVWPEMSSVETPWFVPGNGPHPGR